MNEVDRVIAEHEASVRGFRRSLVVVVVVSVLVGAVLMLPQSVGFALGVVLVFGPLAWWALRRD